MDTLLKKQTSQLPSLGVDIKPEKDKFEMGVKPQNGGFWLGWESSPSAVTRLMPIIIILIIVMVVFAKISSLLIIPAFIAVCLIGAVILYVIVCKPERAIIVDRPTSKLGNKKSDEILDGEIDYQPASEIVASKREVNKKNK